MRGRPPKVDPKDLYSNGKLFRDQDIPAIKQAAKQNIKNGHLRYKASGGKNKGKYNVVQLEDPRTHEKRYFALYYGKKKASERKKSSYALGEGAYGKVKYMQDLGTDTQPGNGGWFAFKLQLASTSSDREKNILREIDQSPGDIAHYKGIGNERVKFDLIGMQLAPGKEMFKALVANENVDLSPRKWMQVARDTLEAMKEIHRQGYWHCDIKPQNLMYDEKTGKVTVIDLGFAQSVNSSEYIIKGTPGFIAPESKMFGIHNEKSEVYQLGITLADIFAVHNNNWKNQAERLRLLTNDEITHNSCFPNKQIRDEFMNLLRHMTAKNPAQRPTLDEAIKRIERLQLAIDKKIKLSSRPLQVDNQVWTANRIDQYLKQQEFLQAQAQQHGDAKNHRNQRVIQPNNPKYSAFNKPKTNDMQATSTLDREMLKSLKEIVADKKFWNKQVQFFGRPDGIEKMHQVLNKIDNLDKLDDQQIGQLRDAVMQIAHKKVNSWPASGYRAEITQEVYTALHEGKFDKLEKIINFITEEEHRIKPRR